MASFVTVEVDISQGLPVFDIVGLPNQAVKNRENAYEQPLKIVDLIFLCVVLLLI